MGSVHRRSALLAGATVRGVSSSGPEAAERLAAEWGVEVAYESVSDIAADDLVDVVHVCSPNFAHADQVAMLLESGKNVICEKPLTVTKDEADHLRELAQASNLSVTVPYVYRFHPMVRELKARAVRGDFGRWFSVTGSYFQDWLWSAEDSNWRVDSTRGGQSRTFGDIGSHWFDLVEWVLDERVECLMAESSTVHPSRPGIDRVDTDDITTVTARTASGTLISATFSQVAVGRKNRLFLEMSGERASAVFDQEEPESLLIGSPTGFNKVVRNPGTNDASANAYSLAPAGHPQGYLECFENFVADSYRHFAGEDVPGLPVLADGHRSVTMIDAVVTSAKTRTWVTVGD
jgi:predicted dehydrogenase